jgi:hypothetical protein
VTKVAWYVRRLRSMGPAEIAWRASHAVRGLAERPADAPASRVRLRAGGTADWSALLADFRAGRGRPVLLDADRMARVAERCPEGAAALVNAADRVAEHRFTLLGYPEADLGPQLDWSQDPLAVYRWPAVAARQIDHRTTAADPKWIWELNRLQHLPWLAQAWLLTGEDRYAAAAFAHLDSWITQNPPGRGIAWRGAFEAGLRGASIAVAVQGLRHSPELTVERYRRIVALLEESARRCRRERSRFSSANNHLLGEMCGLAVVALLMPELASAAAWEREALATLATQAGRQILPDGAGAEQAIGYQLFAVELLMLPGELVRLRDGRAPQAIVDAVERSSAFLAALVGERDPDPRYGDADDGFAIRLDAAPVRTVRDHLAVAAAFTDSDLARRLGTPTTTAAWYDLDRPSPRSAPGPGPAAPTALHARDGGLVLLRARGRRVLMDVGPLGYLSLAAHGHADALSVTVSLDGHDIVGDPGTASYYGYPEWRAVHRSTRAHSTVTVDGTDQSSPGGPFLWTRHAATTVHAVDLDRGLVDAEHDGYRHLARPVGHRRWLLAPPDQDELLVIDLLTGPGRHDVRATWPLAPELDVRAVPGGHLCSRDGSDVVFLGYAAHAPSGGDVVVEQVRGDERSGLGWWATRLERREPAWWVGAYREGELPLAMATLVAPLTQGRAAAEDLAVRHDGEAVRVTWRLGAVQRSVTVRVGAPGAVETIVDGGDG